MRTFLFVVLLAVVNGKPNGNFILNKDNGLEYVLIYQAQPWEKARDKCEEMGAKLAVPRTEEEFAFLQRVVRGMQYPLITNNNEYKLLVWIGVNNLDNYITWKTIDGDAINDASFTKGLVDEVNEGYSNSPAEPHCVGMDAHNPGLRSFWCHRYQPYICQTDVNNDRLSNNSS